MPANSASPLPTNSFDHYDPVLGLLQFGDHTWAGLPTIPDGYDGGWYNMGDDGSGDDGSGDDGSGDDGSGDDGSGDDGSGDDGSGDDGSGDDGSGDDGSFDPGQYDLPWIIVDSLQPLFTGDAQVANNSSGLTVVTWIDAEGTDAGDVYAALLDADGQMLTPPFVVNTTAAGFQGMTSIDMNDAGEFVITWTSENADQTNVDVYAQRFAADGTLVGGEILVNSTTTGNQGQSDVAIAGDGSFVVAWTSGDLARPDNSDRCPALRRRRRQGRRRDHRRRRG